VRWRWLQRLLVPGPGLGRAPVARQAGSVASPGPVAPPSCGRAPAPANPAERSRTSGPKSGVAVLTIFMLADVPVRASARLSGAAGPQVARAVSHTLPGVNPLSCRRSGPSAPLPSVSRRPGAGKRAARSSVARSLFQWPPTPLAGVRRSSWAKLLECPPAAGVQRAMRSLVRLRFCAVVLVSSLLSSFSGRGAESPAARPLPPATAGSCRAGAALTCSRNLSWATGASPSARRIFG